jgi:hypothetical protein
VIAIALLELGGVGGKWLTGALSPPKNSRVIFDAGWDPDDIDLDLLDPIFFELADG